ncbi:MAG: amidohydrolase, partial [Rhodospirillaceae bacterium]
VFIFQPAEEGKAGAKAMIQDGLFDRWPVRGVFGLHNMPGLPEGAIAVSGGPVMAAADEIIVRITGRGGHAAAPDQGRDPILAGASFVQSCQQIVARNVAPWDTGVVSITVFQGGDTFNVTPEQAQLDGTVRFFRPETGAMIRDRLDAIRKGIALAHDVDIELDYLPGYPPTVNDKAAAETAKAAAAAALGAGRALVQDPRMFAEDFSYMLQACPGAYGFIGNGTSRSLHSACYDFNDKILPNGAAWFVTLAETIPTSRP